MKTLNRDDAKHGDEYVLLRDALDHAESCAAAAAAQERKKTKTLQKLLIKASGTMSCERWSTDFRNEVTAAIRAGS